MRKIYIVSEVLCTEEEFGDAHYEKEPLVAFETKEEADTYVMKYEQPNLWRTTSWGSEFWVGMLEIDEIPLCRNEFPIPRHYDPEFQNYTQDADEDEYQAWLEKQSSESSEADDN